MGGTEILSFSPSPTSTSRSSSKGSSKGRSEPISKQQPVSKRPAPKRRSRKCIIIALASIAAILALAGGLTLGLNSNKASTQSSNALAMGEVTLEQCMADEAFMEMMESETKDSAASSSGDHKGADTSDTKRMDNNNDGPLLRRRKLGNMDWGDDGHDDWGNDGHHPYLVSIGSHKSSHSCGGTLISKSVVLTAAHCFTDEYDGGFLALEWVDFNRHDLTADEDVVRVYISDKEGEDVVRHEAWDYRTLENDFALVFLSSESIMDLGDVTPMALNGDADIPSSDSSQSLVVLGWGLTSANPYVDPDVPHVATLEYVSNGDCVSGDPYKWPKDRIAEDMLCAYAEDDYKTVCNLDSGGPIIMNTHSGPVQVGISSFVAKIAPHACAMENFPHVFARVSSGLEWIKSTACRRKGELCDEKKETQDSHSDWSGSVSSPPADPASHSDWSGSVSSPPADPASPSTKSSKVSSPSKSAKTGDLMSFKSKSSKKSSGKSSKSKSGKSKGSKAYYERCKELMKKSKGGKSKSSKEGGESSSAKGSKSSLSHGDGAKSGKSDGGGSDGISESGEINDTPFSTTTSSPFFTSTTEFSTTSTP